MTTLTATMIIGLITMIYLLVTRLPGSDPAPALPANIALPDGARAEAVTLGRGWVAVVTDQDEIIVLDAKSGRIRQRVKIAP